MSPLSISTALTITYFGAKNETAQQIKEALELSHLSDEEILKINEEYQKNIKGSKEESLRNEGLSTRTRALSK
jgi:serine protease inhibitor